MTHVHSAMQFRAKAVFKHLADEVTHYRSEADRNSDKKVIAELFKLLGNSYYGKCITDKEKQQDVSYVDGERATRAVNCPLFRKLEEINEGLHTYVKRQFAVCSSPSARTLMQLCS